jgi:DNA-binding MarR family transcriptional regulator
MEALDRQALGTLSPPLTVPQCYALDALAREPDLSLGELAARMLTVKSNASGIVDRLHGPGLVERREDPLDGRRVRLRLTPAGAESLERAREASSAALARSLGTQDQDRIVTLTELLSDLVLRLRQAAGE